MKNSYYQLIFKMCHIWTLFLVSLILLGATDSLKAQNHLLLSEITLQPAEAEFIEIYNPTKTEIALDDYYLADNQNYPYVPGGNAPPVEPGDFIVRFPEGAVIDANETIVVAINGKDFEAYYPVEADFEIINSSAGIPDMFIIDESSPGISNSGEGIALFYWNGTDDIVKDVDLMNAGLPTEKTRIVDKSEIPGYLPDAYTMPLQDKVPPPGNGYSTKRILLEGQHETHSGGNGITGDDETSEDISMTWDQDYTSPTPGSTELTPSSVEISSDSRSSLKCYPNPASDYIEINLNSNNQKMVSENSSNEIRIVNMMGIEVVKYMDELRWSGDTRLLGNDISSIRIDISHLPKGIYFIQLGSKTAKFVKL